MPQIYTCWPLNGQPARFFAFVENGESRFGDMANAIGLGAVRSMQIEDAIARWGREVAIFALGSNSRVRTSCARDFGWAPQHSSAEAWIEGTN